MNLACSIPASGSIEAGAHLDFKSETFGKVQREIERELRLLAPISKLSLLQKLPGVGMEVLTQHSFPKSAFSKVASYLPKELSRELFEDIEVRRARIRHVKSDGENSYLLQTKSPKRKIDGLKVERDEPTLEISGELFRRLLPLATEGSLSKQRYVAVGNLYQNSSSIELHADVLLAAGKIGKDRVVPPISPALMPGFIVEIEFRSSSQLKEILAGRHSFDSLISDCILLSDAENNSRKALSSSRLARDGFDQLAQKHMRELLEAK